MVLEHTVNYWTAEHIKSNVFSSVHTVYIYNNFHLVSGLQYHLQSYLLKHSVPLLVMQFPVGWCEYNFRKHFVNSDFRGS